MNCSLEDRPRVNHDAYFKDMMIKLYDIILEDKGDQVNKI